MSAEQDNVKQFPSGAMLVTSGVEADDARDAGGASGGLHRGAAFSTSGLWAGVSELAPGHTSVPHHHGDQATIVYIVRGSMTFVVHGEDGHEFTAGPGSFAVIPAGVTHSERNPGDRGCLTVVVRTGETPIVVNVDEERETS
jgi:uncharacterized RmlC-like cupin family protein